MSDKLVIGLSRLIAIQQHVDQIARNIANQDTSGFKSEGLQFQEYLSSASEPLPSTNLRSLVSIKGFTDFSGGTLKATGVATDVAIVGKEFFVVQTPNGERYTRRGSFATDANGRLVTLSGQPVLTQAGVITAPREEGPLAISADGTVSTSKRILGQLRLVRFDDLQKLRAGDGGLFTASGPAIDVPSTDIRLVVGAIESSNVKPILEMSKLVAASNAYQNVAKLIMREESSDELRKLSGQDM